jgi:hypothetical protein
MENHCLTSQLGVNVIRLVEVPINYQDRIVKKSRFDVAWE